jgi:hypothetical protein
VQVYFPPLESFLVLLRYILMYPPADYIYVDNAVHGVLLACDRLVTGSAGVAGACSGWHEDGLDMYCHPSCWFVICIPAFTTTGTALFDMRPAHLQHTSLSPVGNAFVVSDDAEDISTEAVCRSNNYFVVIGRVYVVRSCVGLLPARRFPPMK